MPCGIIAVTNHMAIQQVAIAVQLFLIILQEVSQDRLDTIPTTPVVLPVQPSQRTKPILTNRKVFLDGFVESPRPVQAALLKLVLPLNRLQLLPLPQAVLAAVIVPVVPVVLTPIATPIEAVLAPAATPIEVVLVAPQREEDLAEAAGLLVAKMCLIQIIGTAF